jgi:hypothetical protein
MTAEQTYCDLVVDALDVLTTFAEVKVETKTAGINFTIKVMPRNPRAAEINLQVVEKDVVFLHLGQGTTVDFPTWGGIGSKKVEAAGIEHFVSAVANGDFEEDLFYVGDRLVGAKSVIHFSDRNVPITWSRFGIDLFRKKTKRHIDYEPYS